MHGRHPLEAGEEGVAGTLRRQTHRHQAHGAAGRVAHHAAPERHDRALVAEAHAERREPVGHRGGEQGTGRGQPRGQGVVTGCHGATEDDQAVVLGEPGDEGLSEVAPDDVELEAELAPPLPEPRHGGVGLVLHDEEARHQPTCVPTAAPIP